nr:MAG TPA: hypothetical protein [Caudoviricetes sp.]DAZ68101.1 MAG TPA: hypothetical protein [Caudoviricetes sp.]
MPALTTERWTHWQTTALPAIPSWTPAALPKAYPA